MVISLKNKKLEKYEEIKIGQRYKLTINPALTPRLENNVARAHIMVYIFTEGMWIPVQMSTLDIYTTPNLEGLYYIPSPTNNDVKKKR